MTFAGRAGFGGATFTDDTAFFGTTFGGAAEFGGATFADGAGRLPFRQTRALSSGNQHVWPTGWRLVPDRRGGFLVARAKHDAALTDKSPENGHSQEQAPGITPENAASVVT